MKWVEISRIEEKEIKRLIPKGSDTRFYNKLETLLTAEEMSLFAKPRNKGPIGTWEYLLSKEQETTITSYDLLTSDEQEAVAYQLEQLKDSILEKISRDGELKVYSIQFFEIPSERAIVQIKRDEGSFPVLTQWACQLARADTGISTLTKIFKSKAKDRSRVTLSFSYEDDGPLSPTDFAFEYNGPYKKIRPNDKGECNLETFKHGSTINICQYYKGEPCSEQQITVGEQDKVYPVVFPFLTDASVLVVNQKDEPMLGFALQATSKGQQRNFETDNTGRATLHQLEAGQALELSTVNSEHTEQYQLQRDGNDFTFKVFQQVTGSFEINVLDRESKEPVPHYAVKVIKNGAGISHTSDSQGKIHLSDIEVGTSLLLRDGDDEKKTDTYTYSLDLGKVDFYIDKPEAPNIRVNLINRKKDPVPGASIVFNGNANLNRQTNDSGFCELDQGSFSDGEKVKAFIELPQNGNKDEKKTKKPKRYKGSFKYHEDQSTYTLIIGRRYRLLWWLMLLLPLLLLIPFKKDIGVGVYNSETGHGIQGTDVHLKYERSALFASGKLPAHDTLSYIQKADSNGQVVFRELSYTLYSLLFKRGNECSIWAGDACYGADSVVKHFHSIEHEAKLDLKLNPAFVSLDFMVVDKSDKEPLPDARVVISAVFDDKEYIDSGRTDAAGRVLFRSIPECAMIRQVKASLFGYYPDTFSNRTLESVLGPVEGHRQLELEPILKPITFYVVDCQSGKPISDVRVTIEFDHAYGKSSQVARPNVNGVGKGFYKDAHIISKIHLKGTHPYYNPGELAGWHLVNKFINYSKGERTFCLEPKPKPVGFVVIDKETKVPLKGASVAVRVRKTSGVIDSFTTVSRADGSFDVSGLVNGDILSIRASHDPYYYPNDSSIRDEDVFAVKLFDQPLSARTLPLRPKIVKVCFRTIDSTTRDTLHDVGLIISGKGLYNYPKTSGNSTFCVRARLDGEIAIFASKYGYQPNDSKIPPYTSIAKLQKSSQSRRDIPLLENTPDPCQNSYGPDGIHQSSVDVFKLNKRQYQYSLIYDFDGAPDEITIYCGKDTKGKVLVPTQSLTYSGAISLDLSNCKGKYITVEVNGDTNWKYHFECN